MRVVEVTKFGGPEVLEVKTVPDPVAGPGQVVIDVAAAGVLSVDMMIRRGHGGEYFPVQPPYVPGAGVAGTVSSAGDGVDPGWVGRRVIASVNGGYASHAVADIDGIIPVPDGLGLQEAMAMIHDGSTALALFEATPVQPGESVLVQPAAGAAGSFLVQLLHASGARVIAVARGSHKLTLAKELGADTVVDYSDPEWANQVGTVDVAFDGVGGQPGHLAFSAVRPGGRYSNYGNASGAPADVPRDGTVKVQGMEQLMSFRPDSRRRAEHMLAEAAAGRLKVIIGQTFPLDQAAEAHTALEARTITGKALLIP